MENRTDDTLGENAASSASERAVLKGYFEREKFSPSVVALAVLFVVFFLYQIIGGAAAYIIAGGGITDENLSAHRAVQIFAQLAFLAIPTFIATSLHTGESRLFALQNRRYLALDKLPTAIEILAATLGILSLNFVASYVGDVQLVFMTNVLGLNDVVETLQAQYKAIIEKYALSRSLTEFFIVVLTIALTPAVCEELLFRGYVQRGFSRAMRPINAVIFTGVIFGLYHLNPIQAVPLVIIGIYISYLRYSSGTLLLPMLAHFTMNLFSSVGLWAVMNAEKIGMNDLIAKRIYSDEPDVSSPVAVSTALISAVIFALLMRLYHSETKRAPL
jgi:membrane protease YdiL (CAAX protease family)